jgi:hypothetical protein
MRQRDERRYFESGKKQQLEKHSCSTHDEFDAPRSDPRRIVPHRADRVQPTSAAVRQSLQLCCYVHTCFFFFFFSNKQRAQPNSLRNLRMCVYI